MPSAVLTKLSGAAMASLDSREVRRKFQAVGFISSWTTPEGYADNIPQNLKN